jgi:UPF0716 protein FxsA
MFLVVPLLELFVIVNVAGSLGILPTIAILVTVSLAGAWLLKREGTGAWRRIQQQIAELKAPTDSLIDGALIVFAGALMLTPGFITDIVGLLMMFPPTRIPLRTLLRRRYGKRLQTATVGRVAGGGFGATMGGAGGMAGTGLGGFRVFRDVVDGRANDAGPPQDPFDMRGESARVNDGPWGGSHSAPGGSDEVIDAESWEEPTPRPEIDRS